MKRTHLIGIGVAGSIVATAFAVLLFPLLQNLGYTLFVKNPATVWWGLIGAGVVYAAYRWDHELSEYATIAAIVAIVLLAFGVAPFMSGVYAQEDIVHNQQFEQVDTLPDTSTDHVRVLPRNVGDRYAESANQLPRYETGDSDIAYHNGTYTWAYGIEPDRLAVKIMGNQWGAFYVDMEQTGRSVETRQQTMTHGMGMMVIDNYDYQMRLNRPLADHKPDTAFVFEDDGETHIAQSYVNHEWRFKFAPLPQPYAVPKYGGTMVVDSDGNIDDLSPNEVVDDPRLESQNTYPYDLARFRMSSMRLQNGLLNALFIGEDVPQIADTGGFSDNEQPFVVPTGGENGTPDLTYFIAATPASSGDGIYQVYTLDSQTGAIEYVQFNSTQAGPQKAAGYTRSQDREPNWAANNEDGSTQITEPIPLVIDDTLYWHMRVTPTDGARISYTTFVNADTGTVYRADGTEAIYEFIRSSGDDEVLPSDNGTKTPDTAFTVIVLNDDGSVSERVEVTPDQTVQVTPNGTEGGE